MAVAQTNPPPGKSYIPRTGETLVRWREPKAYCKKNFSGRDWLLPSVCLSIAIVSAVAAYDHRLSKQWRLYIVLSAIFLLICFACFFARGIPACLKDDYLTIPGGNSPLQFLYNDMISCTVRFDSFKGNKFAVLTFLMKRSPRAFAPKSLQLGAPNDAILQRILTILRMKGVNVVEK